jgi:hypothetical protein
MMPPPNRRRYANYLLPAVIVAAIAIAYGNTLHDPFIFDDGHTIVNNDHIRSLWPLSESMTTSPLSELAGRPVVCLSLAVNYSLGGLNPVGYHLFNIATHIACALLLYALLCRTPGVPSRWFAGAAALVWAMHPLQTESVTYVTQRTETLMSMFLLLMLYAMTHRGWRWRVVAVAACALGMGCKEIMVVAPLLAMLYGWMFLPREKGRRSLYAGLLATWIILPLELMNADLDSKSGYGIKYVYWFDYLKTQAGVIVHYLCLTFWPRGQAIDYFDWPLVKNIAPAIAPGLFIVFLILASAAACYRRWWPGFLGAWFFLILSPTSSVLPNFTEIAAERRMYLPLAAVVVLTLAFLWKLPRRGVVVALLATVLGGLTIARNQTYRSAVAVWSDAVAKRPENPRAHVFLGQAYADAKDWNNAWAEDDAALRLSPDLTMALDLRQRLEQSASRPDTPVSPAGH